MILDWGRQVCELYHKFRLPKILLRSFREPDTVSHENLTQTHGIARLGLVDGGVHPHIRVHFLEIPIITFLCLQHLYDAELFSKKILPLILSEIRHWPKIQQVPILILVHLVLLVYLIILFTFAITACQQVF